NAPVCVDTDASPSGRSRALGGSAPNVGAGICVMSAGDAQSGLAIVMARSAAIARANEERNERWVSMYASGSRSEGSGSEGRGCPARTERVRVGRVERAAKLFRGEVANALPNEGLPHRGPECCAVLRLVGGHGLVTAARTPA